MPAFLSEEDLDEVEEITYSQPRGKEAEALEEHARSLEPGARLRAELLRAASESWFMRGHLDDALRCAEDAVSDGGPAWIDPRGQLLGVLLAREDPRAEEVIRELRGGLRNLADPDLLIEVVAEDLTEAGREREALRWFSIGLADIDPDDIADEDTHLHGLLGGRSRIRRSLGLGIDRFDAAAARVQHFLDERDRRESGDWGTDRDAVGLHLLYWPEADFERLVERWPDMADGYGGSAAAHLVETEGHLRTYADEGVTVSVGAGDFLEFLEFAETKDVDPRTGVARASYASELGRTGRTTAWPPGRNDPCWCGSGTKYKRCCGSAATASQ